MSDESQDRPLVDDLAEQTDDLPRDAGVSSTGAVQDDRPSGDSYEERDDQEEGRA
jgi:hypothetical protein